MTSGPATARLPGLRFLQPLQLAWEDLRGRMPAGATPLTGFAEALPVLLPGDAEVARQLYRGRFTFAGQTVACQPADVFIAQPPSAAWETTLHSFGWLAHLEAGELALYRAFARTLVSAGLTAGLAHHFDILCARLLAFARHGGFLLQGAPARFEERLLEAVSADVRRLVKTTVRSAGEALQQSAAILAAALAFQASTTLRDEALARCAAAAAGAVLPDGAPADRSARSLVATLSLLLPLRDLMTARRLAIPQDLNAAIERGLPMLRMLCHGDGGLAVFQGVNGTCGPMVKAIVARDSAGGKPLAHAPYGGYARLSQGAATVIADCGGRSHCDSALAFEFSDGAQRIVTSCGVPAHGSAAWVAAASMAAAHSTLDLEDGGGQKLESFFRRRKAQERPTPVAAEHLTTPHGALLKASSGRLAASLGLTHIRELFLAANGCDLRGEDRFERVGAMERGWPEKTFALRFHLYPGVDAVQERPGSPVHLTLGDGTRWQFTARGGDLSVEDSLFLATGGVPRACRQIVIHGEVGRPDIVNWAFRKTTS